MHTVFSRGPKTYCTQPELAPCPEPSLCAGPYLVNSDLVHRDPESSHPPWSARGSDWLGSFQARQRELGLLRKQPVGERVEILVGVGFVWSLLAAWEAACRLERLAEVGRQKAIS